MKPMACNYIETELDDLLDGRLERSARQVLEAHLAGCADCRGTLAHAQRVLRAVRALPVPGPTPDFFERALERAAAAPPGEGAARRRPHTGIMGALAAGLVGIVIGGWLLRQSDAPSPDAFPSVSIALHETRTVNLVFASAQELDGVRLTVDLPDGIELAGYPGRDEVRFTTRLQAGKNVLPLELVAVAGTGGELVARLRHEDKEKTFMVSVAVTT